MINALNASLSQLVAAVIHFMTVLYGHSGFRVNCYVHSIPIDPAKVWAPVQKLVCIVSQRNPWIATPR